MARTYTKHRIRALRRKILKNASALDSSTKIGITVFVLIFAALGTYTIFRSFAASSPVTMEAESGTLSGNAATISDTNASGGSAVKFGAGSTSSSCDLPNFPNESCTGTPPGWVPTQTVTKDMNVNTPGAVIQNIRFANGSDLNVNAANVTVKDVEFQGGMINTSGPNTLIEDSTFDRLSPETTGGEGAVSYCGYTAIRVKMLDRSEGFRESGCDAGTLTEIQDSFVRITPPDWCEDGTNTDWHGDGIQGYYGTNLHVDHVTIDFHEDAKCQATSPFFYNGGSGGSPNGHAFVNNLLLKGGGETFRQGTPAPNSVQGLKIVNNSWRYTPIDVYTSDGGGCAAINPWEAKLVEVNANWQITKVDGNLPCTNSN